jgi:hypothetical protein
MVWNTFSLGAKYLSVLPERYCIRMRSAHPDQKYLKSMNPSDPLTVTSIEGRSLSRSRGNVGVGVCVGVRVGVGVGDADGVVRTVGAMNHE